MSTIGDKDHVRWLDAKAATSNGKGDTPRPIAKEQYDKNFDMIDWTKKEKDEKDWFLV